MKEKFEDRRLNGTIRITVNESVWTADKYKLCQNIISIIQDYLSKGYRLTLRQLYYQLVSKDLIPNHDKLYKKMSALLDDLRYSGLVDWNAIEDRGRIPYLPYSVNGVKDAIEDAALTYRIDRQQGQSQVVEVWTEKDAISGILKRITQKYHVRLVVNKGYSSSTAMHRAYLRFAEQINEGNKVTVLYFGDHDPSGLDMIRDIRERINFFLSKGDMLNSDLVDQHIEEEYEDHDKVDLMYLNDDSEGEKLQDLFNGESQPAFWKAFDSHKQSIYVKDTVPFEVIPIGLTMEQINEFNPPPNPAKISDPRAKWYIKQYGNTSWEVDAIEPEDMEEIVEQAIKAKINFDKYEEVVEQETLDKIRLNKIAKKINKEE